MWPFTLLRRTVGALLAAVVVVGAVRAAGAPPLSPRQYAPSPPPKDCPGVDPRDLALDPNFQRACSDVHWLALASGHDAAGRPFIRCPAVDGWRAEPLFDAATAYDGRPLFCRYDWVVEPPKPCKEPGGPGPKSAKPDAAAIQRLLSHSSLHGVVRRCAVVGILQSAVSGADPRAGELSRDLLYRELRFQVGATDLPLPQGQAPAVRLAIVDTQPSGIGPPQEPCPKCSVHGYAMAHIARNLTCPPTAWESSTCAATLSTRLALPLNSPGDDPDPEHEGPGGSFGRPSDLAVAIDREVTAWQERKAEAHLILNLSVGWDPELLHEKLPGRGPDGLNAEELAVYDALTRARGRGVLIFAASGNSPGGWRPGERATLPARWYGEGPMTRGLLEPAPEPLLYAIGGIDRNDRPLANVRRQSLPPLVAYGDHASVPVPGGGWTKPLTGTSVSAVVASSIAAVAWHLRPELDPQRVMDLLAQSASDLRRDSDLYPDLSAPPVKRLRFTSALSWSWSRTVLDGSRPRPLAPPGRNCRNAVPATMQCGQELVEIKVCPDESGAIHPPQRCPPTQLTSVSSVPWVLTQPGSNPCPSCSLVSGPPPVEKSSGSGGWTLHIHIADDYADGCLIDPVLEILNPATNQVVSSVAIPLVDALCAKDSLDTLVDDPGEGPARVTFTLKDSVTKNPPGYSVESQVYIGWHE